MAYIEINGVREDAPRNIGRVELEIEVAPWQMSQVLPGGALVGPGKHTVTVYADEVEAVERLVHTDVAGLEAARKSFDNKLKAHNEELSEAGVDPATKPIPWSVEAEYRQQSGGKRDVLPLLSAKKVRDLPPPAMQREVEGSKVIADAVAAAIATTMPTIIQSVAAELAKTSKRS